LKHQTLAEQRVREAGEREKTAHKAAGGENVKNEGSLSVCQDSLIAFN